MRRAGLAVILAALCGCDASGSDAPGFSDLPNAPDAPDVSVGTSRAAQSRAGTKAVYVLLQGRPLAEIHLAHATRDAAPRPLTREFNALQAQHERLTPFLESLGAEVVAHHMRLANAVQVLVPAEKIVAIAAHPEVTAVEPVTLFERSNADAAANIGATEVWERYFVTGEGVTVGILDSGIDYYHAHFGGDGNRDTFRGDDETVIEPGSFPTEKVIGGWDFVGNAYNPWGALGARSPRPDADPVDCGGHGSHVAGTVAGFGVLSNGQTFDETYQQSFSPSDFRIGPGMAPMAQLYAIKVFGCDGPTEMVASALERASDPNRDGDFSDRLDVVNASLGAGYGLGTGAEQNMVNTLAALGTVFVAAAGNDGSDGRPYFSVGAPAVYDGAFAVAATLNRELQFSALRVDSPESLAGLYPIAEADFSRPLTSLDELSESLAAVEPTLACSTLTNAADLAGKVAIIRRGDCMFVDKVERVAKAGAVGAIIVDNVESDTPFNMAGRGTSTSIPAVLIRRRDGEQLLAQAADVAITMGGDLQFPETLGPDYVTSFSSRGPNSIDGGIKPEISAPGNSLASALVGSGNGMTRMAGTSMASPVVAGAVALVVEAHPDFTPREIKAVMMGTAAPVETFYEEAFPISLSGAGRIQVDAAIRSTVLVTPTQGAATALSFGVVNVVDTATELREVSVENRGLESVTFETSTLFARELPGVSVEVEPATFTVEPGETQLVGVGLVVDATQLPPSSPDGLTPGEIRGFARSYLMEQGGWVRFSDKRDGEQSTSIAFQAVVRGAGQLGAGEIKRCDLGTESKVHLSLTGSSPLVEQWTSAFELLAENPATGVLAIGITSDAATAGWDDGKVYVGVALEDEWTTPARGPLTALGLVLDVGSDGVADFIVQPFANSPGNEDISNQGAEIHADVMVARLVSVGSGERVSDQVLNVLTPATADTRVFFSNLLVFPVSLRDIGLTEDSALLSVSVSRGQGLISLPSGGYFSADLSAPAFASDSDSPLNSTADGPLRFTVDPEADNLPLLLLHHENVKAKRVEVVDLAIGGTIVPEDGNLVLRHELGAPSAEDGTREVTLELSNESTASRAGVWFKASLDAGEPNEATEPSGAVAAGKLGSVRSTPAGACTVYGLDVSCRFGELPAGESVSVQIRVTPGLDAGPEDVTVLRAEVGSELECELDTSDNVASVEVPGAGSAPPGPADPAGCGCSTQRSGSGPLGIAGIAGFLALAAARRRRRAR